MLQAAIAQELKYDDKKNETMNTQAQIESYIAKVNNPVATTVRIDRNDTELLSKTIKKDVKKLNISFFQALCHIKFFCKRKSKFKI